MSCLVCDFRLQIIDFWVCKEHNSIFCYTWLDVSSDGRLSSSVLSSPRRNWQLGLLACLEAGGLALDPPCRLTSGMLAALEGRWGGKILAAAMPDGGPRYRL